MRFNVLALALALTACGQSDGPMAQRYAQFDLAVARVLPVAEDLCRQRTPHQNCDFAVVIDTGPSAIADARQSLTPQGRPVLTVNTAMITQAENLDEIAFVLAHEASHHVQAHLPQLRAIAAPSPALGVTSTKGTPAGVARARAHLKGFELEADALGAQIAVIAGFDPVRGAAIIARIAPHGAVPSVSHPSGAERLRTITRDRRFSP